MTLLTLLLLVLLIIGIVVLVTRDLTLGIAILLAALILWIATGTGVLTR